MTRPGIEPRSPPAIGGHSTHYNLYQEELLDFFFIMRIINISYLKPYKCVKEMIIIQ